MRWRRFFHGIMLLAMVAVAGSGWALRAHGRAMAREIVTGMPAAAVAGTAGGNARRWASWRDFLNHDPFAQGTSLSQRFDRHLLAGWPGPPTTAMVAEASRLAPGRERLHRLLMEPGPVLDLPDGLVPGDAPDSGRLPDIDDYAFMWDTAQDLGLVARCSDDPGPPLEDLDRLARACSPANSLMTLQMMCPVWDERDDIYLAEACAGFLPDASRRRWSGEDDHRADLRAAIAGERRHWVPASAAWAAEAGPWAFNRHIAETVGVEDLPAAVRAWWDLAAAARRNDADLQAAVASLDLDPGSHAAAFADDGEGAFNLLSTPGTPMITHLGQILMSDTRHRLAVLAVQAITAWRLRGALPENGVGLDLAGGGGRMALTWETIDPHRFRIRVTGAATWAGYPKNPAISDDSRVLQARLTDAEVLVDVVPHTRLRGMHALKMSYWEL